MDIMASNADPPLQDSSATASRRERKSAGTRERLFRSALHLFATKGFAETTVEDITEAADVGKGTFFNYFPSKDHILLAFSDMQLARLEEAVDQLAAMPIPIQEFLQALVLRMTEEPSKNPGMIRALLQGYLSSTAVREIMTEKQERAHRLHTRMVKIGQSRGELRIDIPAKEIAHVFRQTIVGTLMIWSVTGDASLPDRLRAALHMLWSGIAAKNAETRAAKEISKGEMGSTK
jgi:AcrR family transcriptional regulator